jgi:hypothetical protein
MIKKIVQKPRNILVQSTSSSLIGLRKHPIGWGTPQYVPTAIVTD